MPTRMVRIVQYCQSLSDFDCFWEDHVKPRTPAVLALLATLVALVVAGCGGSSDEKGGDASASGSSDPSTELSLVAYSTPQVVYDEIIPDFARTPDGRGVGFKTSFGASGDQSRAVEAGQKADVVTFSTEPDMTRLVDAGLVGADWNRGANKGLVTTSVVSFVVRRGNPKNIRTWDDLLRPDVKVLTPNPFTSGAAKWNLLAAYGQAARGGSDPQAGLDYVRELITRHVEVQDRSGREALQNFVGGNADVLLSYEYEATTAQKKGEDVDYVIPDDTIRIDIDIAAARDAPAQARTFLDYVLSEPAQQRFAAWGYRPVNETVLAANRDRFPTPSGLFTIDDLGGWSRVNDEFFDIDNGSITKIEDEAGVSTAK
jgi:sulfate/thiosulfate-binding protein